MSEVEVVPIEIPDRVLAQVIGLAPRRLNDFDAVGAVKLVELIGISDDEVHGAPFRGRRALAQEYLDAIKIHPSERRRLPLRERDNESELVRVELGGGTDISDRQRRVVLFAIDVGLDMSTHMALAFGLTRSRRNKLSSKTPNSVAREFIEGKGASVLHFEIHYRFPLGQGMQIFLA
jgi:hypothetical protein